MSNKTRRDYDRQQKMVEIVSDIFRQVRDYHLTHEQYIERCTERLWSNPIYKGLTWHRRSFVEGYHQALYNQFTSAWGIGSGVDWRILLKGEYLLAKDIPKDSWRECETGAFFHKGTLDRWS